MNKLTFNRIRDMFFEDYPEFKCERKRMKTQNEYSCECSCMFVDYVDMLHKNGQITDSQAFRITLG